ncbi:sensor histidine kinase [Nocardioides jensenii]|uniref:sensor histidine kinase n=1 Tax=Nocardioides jensenii TaxID=1843 RepID=UPI000831822B|nr:HAMP domain-containing sensor histidine kinase [Nocardioides jensenii]
MRLPTIAHRDVRRGPGVSVRVRITATVAVLVALALASAGGIIYALESARLESTAADQADQEIAEFRQLQQQGTDPTTAKPFANVEDLLYVFLQRNVPSDDELFAAWLDDRPKYESTADHPGFSDSSEFREIVRKHLRDGGSEHLDSRAGEILVTVQPVRGNRSSGALVVVTFLDDARSDLNSLMRTYAIVSLLSLGLISALAAWQAGRLLAPLREMNRTAREISDTDLSLRLSETGNDDITALTRTVNDMLARLEASFTNQREFLDAAGHELKTPLTVLRGHLELLDADDPEEVAETRALLLDEVDRMARLVGDLILLAKSARPDFVTRSAVELGPFTATVLAKARGLGDRTWTIDGTSHRTVLLDEQRITQALLQLADNAVKHTTAGDTVAIGSADEGDRIELWVRDTGHGVRREDRTRIFDKFARSTVLRGDDGFGLGLSIVRAVVEAHGGTVAVEDAVPRGALFRISLPADHRSARPVDPRDDLSVGPLVGPGVGPGDSDFPTAEIAVTHPPAEDR